MARDDDEMLAGKIEQTAAARARHAREGDLTIGRMLALAGQLGWALVLPILAGAFAGRWLDRQFDSGIFWSAGLIVAGAGLGYFVLWRRLRT